MSLSQNTVHWLIRRWLRYKSFYTQFSFSQSAQFLSAIASLSHTSQLIISLVWSGLTNYKRLILASLSAHHFFKDRYYSSFKSSVINITAKLNLGDKFFFWVSSIINWHPNKNLFNRFPRYHLFEEAFPS